MSVTDHGSDRYGYVEVQGAPDGVSPPDRAVDRAFEVACRDCNPNLFFRWARREEPVDPRRDPRLDIVDVHGHRWIVTVAHDYGCPTLAEIEAGW